MRVHEFAKKLNISSKEALTLLQKEGIEVKSHMSKVDDEVAELLLAETGKPASESGESGRTPEPGAGEKKPEPAPEQPVAVPDKKIVEKHKKPAEPEIKAEPDVKASPEPEAVSGEPEIEEQPVAPEKPDADKVIRFQGHIIVRDLAEKMGLKPNQLITELMMMNVLASINERLDVKIAQQIAEKHGWTIEYGKKGGEPKKAQDTEDDSFAEEDAEEDLVPRPPVVTFLGHIDHGKTSLLDRIRNTAVASGEAGGITQHIGAYSIEYNGQRITFLDTPGHAAFTAMRARGANLTDIAVIVIAADDGIMPQTEEAIQHALAAKTSIIIAINKIDMPGANVDMVKQQLQARNLSPEDWGGEVICCPVSAHTGEGMDYFLEMLLLQAEILELKANPRRKAQGYVVEAKLETGRGPTATLLVTRGTLKTGDSMVCGQHWGRVKALIDEHNRKLKEAGPSTPVKCLGLSGVPEAGEKFMVLANDKAAKSMAERRALQVREESLAIPKRKASLDDLFADNDKSKKLELCLIIKCDTQGSIEAIKKSLDDIASEKVAVAVLMAGVGNVTENDILLASASNAIVAGFNVGKGEGVSKAQKAEGVEVRLYDIIYAFVDDVKKAMTGMLLPEIREKAIGKAEVRQIFDISKKGNIAGCLVVNGRISAKAYARIKRQNEVVYEGGVTTIRRFQDEVSEVREGQECGIRLTNYSDFETGDIIEFFIREEFAQKL